jgi:hypothetical protein
MENKFQLQFLHVASIKDGYSIYKVGEYPFELEKEGYDFNDTLIIKTSANLFEKEGKLFIKFDFVFNSLKINSELECELYDFIGGEAVYFYNKLFELNAYSFFIFKNDFIIQGTIKRVINEDGKRIDLFNFIFYGNIDNELKSKLPWRPYIYEFM